MERNRYDFSDPKKYLHHRHPYLMVDAIIEIGDDFILTEKRVSGEEFFLAGHFPGAPIFPGAMMQELTTQSAGILIAARYNPMKEFDTEDPFFNEFALGVLTKIKSARFKDFARPGDALQSRVELEAHASNAFEFSAQVFKGEQRIMRNRFQLANVASSLLQGQSQTGSLPS